MSLSAAALLVAPEKCFEYFWIRTKEPYTHLVKHLFQVPPVPVQLVLEQTLEFEEQSNCTELTLNIRAEHVKPS